MAARYKTILDTAQAPVLDTEQVPDYTSMYLGQSLFRAIHEYFMLPGVQEEFERWKAKKAAEAAVKEAIV